jgi:uncharacterized membrane protein
MIPEYRAIQITDKDEVLRILKERFVFPQEGYPTDVFALSVAGKIVGYVAVENITELCGNAHLFVYKDSRTAANFVGIKWIIIEVLYSLYRAMGKTQLVSSCDLADKGTRRILNDLGFTLVETVIASIQL